jgi:hypothetical protein
LYCDALANPAARAGHDRDLSFEFHWSTTSAEVSQLIPAGNQA